MDLPPGWERVADKKGGAPYFWNKKTNEVSWTKPSYAPPAAARGAMPPPPAPPGGAAAATYGFRAGDKSAGGAVGAGPRDMAASDARYQNLERSRVADVRGLQSGLSTLGVAVAPPPLGAPMPPPPMGPVSYTHLTLPTIYSV